MTAAEKACLELRELGTEAEIVEIQGFPASQAVVLGYRVQSGRYQRQQFQIAISFQEEGYPEYPPHFLHVRSLPDSSLPLYRKHQHDGSEWSAFSVPPSDFWDGLPPQLKNMKTYFHRHMARVWDQM